MWVWRLNWNSRRPHTAVRMAFEGVRQSQLESRWRFAWLSFQFSIPWLMVPPSVESSQCLLRQFAPWFMSELTPVVTSSLDSSVSQEETMKLHLRYWRWSFSRTHLRSGSFVLLPFVAWLIVLLVLLHCWWRQPLCCSFDYVSFDHLAMSRPLASCITDSFQ